MGRNGWAAGEGHRDRGSNANLACCCGSESQELIGIVLGLLDQYGVQAQFFGQCRTSCELADLQWRLGLAETWVEFAEGEKRLYEHAQV